MTSTNDSPAPVRVSLREGLLLGELYNISSVRLAGCKCADCGETSLGERLICPNCGQSDVSTVALGNVGTLWSFTVIRHRPPGDYRGPTPFAPFGLGLVELTEGLRVLSPIDVDVDALEIGLPLRFHPYVMHDPEKDVVAFSYVPNLGATLDV